jgi:hypothetical protein
MRQAYLLHPDSEDATDAWVLPDAWLQDGLPRKMKQFEIWWADLPPARRYPGSPFF